MAATVKPAMSDRGNHILRSFAGAWQALAEHAKKYPHEAEMIVAGNVAHIKNAAPTALVDTGPVARVELEEPPTRIVERELADGSTVRIAAEGNCVTVRIGEAEQRAALATLTPIEQVRFRADFTAVASSAGGSRG